MKNNEQTYSKAFYSKIVLAAAIKDYKKIAKIKLSEDAEYFKCEFSKCAAATQLVIDEFGNYLIELMNSHGENAEHDFS